MKKTCSKCLIEQDILNFSFRVKKKNIRRSECKSCSSKRAKLYIAKNKESISLKKKQYRIENKDSISIYMKGWRDKNKDHIKKYNQDNKEHLYQLVKNWKLKNIEQINERRRINYKENKEEIKRKRDICISKNPEKYKNIVPDWRKNNPEKYRLQMMRGNRKREKNLKYKISSRISNAIRLSINKGSKGGRHWEDILGYTFDQLKNHLEELFKPGMSWENYGVAWEIDHKIPVSVFNFETPEHEDFKRCWDIKNLQPLDPFENKSKGARLEKHFQPSLALKLNHGRISNDN